MLAFGASIVHGKQVEAPISPKFKGLQRSESPERAVGSPLFRRGAWCP